MKSTRPPAFVARPVLAAGLGVALVLAGTVGCERRLPREEGEDRTLVLVTIDTLRSDRLGAYGNPRGLTPVLDALARESVLFTECASPSSWTMPAMGTLATGLRPNAHGMVYWHLPLDPGVPTLAESLAAAGVVSAFFGNPIPRLPGLDRGFDRWETFEGDDAAAVEAALAWLRRSGGGRFAWIHLLSPHAPYDPQRGTVRPGEDLPEKSLLYDGEVRTVDHLLRPLLRALPPGDAVLVSADHGETLHERGDDFAYDHGSRLYEELLRVPLIARLPGGRPRLVSGTVLLADVPATIAEWFGASPLAEAAGLSLVSAIAGTTLPPRTESFAFVVEDDPPDHTDRRWSLRHGTRKAVLNVDRDSLTLFDLRSDPRELVDVAPDHPAEARALRERIVAWEAEEPTPAIPFGRRFSPEEQRRLHSLGYLGGRN